MEPARPTDVPTRQTRRTGLLLVWDLQDSFSPTTAAGVCDDSIADRGIGKHCSRPLEGGARAPPSASLGESPWLAPRAEVVTLPGRDQPRQERGPDMTNYITLAEAAKMLPTRPAVCTVWRWCTKGLHVRRTGQVVRMRCVFIGRKMLTTPDSVEEFIHRLTAARMGRYEPVIDRKPLPHARPPMTPAEVEEILRQAGI